MTEQEIREKIKSILCKYQKKHIRFIKDQELIDYFNDIKVNKFKNNSRAVITAIMNDIYEWPKCIVCGNDVKCLNGIFMTTCSQKCAHKIIDYSARNKVREKTCLERYGVKHNWASKDLRNKTKQKILETYGVTSYSQTDEFKQKYKKTCLEKYGVENYLSTKEARDRIKQTCLKKYGVKYHPQDELAKIKRKNTMQSRYGVDTPFALQTSLEKQQNWRNETSFNKLVEMNTECTPLFTREEFDKYGATHMYAWKCKRCGYEFEHTARTHNNGYHIIRCEKCSPNSLIQKELQDFIAKYVDDVQFNTRNIIPPKELDIYIPSKQLAIEFNGVFFHNDYHVESNYHLNKTELCKEKGIQLIHIWDCDYVTKPQIIQDRIKNLLGIYEVKIYARNCTVKEISFKNGSEFIDKYHLQGKDTSKVYLGLFHDNELISVMSFKTPRFTDSYEYELVRFVNKSGYHIIGGAGKLLSYFEHTYTPKSIITYADKCWSNGKLYERLGFTHDHDTLPGYFYSKNNVKYSRYMCQKHKLPELLGEKFNPELSESDNMKVNQYNKVYDCGHKVYIKKYEQTNTVN